MWRKKCPNCRKRCMIFVKEYTRRQVTIFKCTKCGYKTDFAYELLE